MKKHLLFTTAIIAGIAICFSACNKEESTVDPKHVQLDLPQTPYNYNSFNHSDEMITLGRVLFYDGRLSVNTSVSCASCHKQVIAFSDDKKFSLGFQNVETGRNALPIQNLEVNGQNNTHLFWDGREVVLDNMVVKPILNHIEMGMDDHGAIVEKIKAASYYPSMFTDAFGSEEINIEKISTALAAFTGSINSENSLFDKAEKGLATLNAQQERGRELFNTTYNCNSCHQTQELNGYQFGGSFTNIGLDEVAADIGRGEVTNFPGDDGLFKIPNLRNVALTGPYMHDGRFETLEQVIDHYSTGIKAHPNLDPRLRDLENPTLPAVLNITPVDKAAIIAFLNTMTDYSMITDPRYADPFKRIH